MEIKPIITSESNENKIINEVQLVNATNVLPFNQATNISHKKTLDPEGIIPNHIYKLLNGEKNFKRVNLIIFSLIFLFSLIACFLFAFAKNLFNNLIKDENVTKIPWGWYVLPAILIAISIPYFFLNLNDFIFVKKTFYYYREKIKRNDFSVPTYIKNLYLKLIKRQARRTWLVVALIFYLGVFTLIFWGIKDQKWGLLDFQKWIYNSFANPNVLVYSICGIMLTIILVFIIATIYRKKKITDIQVYFGDEVMSYEEFNKEKTNAYKFWAKIFFLSVLILLVIPIIILLIIARVRKRN